MIKSGGFFLLLLFSATTALTAQDKTLFKNPDNRFRPNPLWFWNNSSVTRSELNKQLSALNSQCGYGGVSILPFGKDFTPKYLSSEYFELYEYAAHQARSLGMRMALYDEYGFPSGSGGMSNGDSIPRFMNRYPSLTLKRLDKIEEEVSGGTLYHKPVSTAGTLMGIVAMKTDTKERFDLTDRVTDGVLVWKVPAGKWKIMQFVCVTDGDPKMDYLSKEAAAAYIEMTHEQYYKRMPEYFGSTITETFFDEPTLYYAQGRVWTPSFNKEFVARYGTSPVLYYPALWYDIGPQTAAARNALYTLRSDLYAEAYMQAIDSWSRAHGVKATGHQDNEEIENPVGTSGDLMKCFKYLEIPGIDKIGGNRPAERFYKLISSAAYNWDHSLVMSETYGAMGNLSWDSIYLIAMDQFTKGINLLIPHAAWYNDKRVTFLPELSSRNPTYKKELPAFTTFLGRMHLMMQNSDRFVSEVALLYPIATMQGEHVFDGPLSIYEGGMKIPYLDYVRTGMLLSDTLGRDYQWLHPEVLEEKCRADKHGMLVLDGTTQYNSFHTLIIPASRTIAPATLEKAVALFRGGGKVIFTSRLPEKSALPGTDNRIHDLMVQLLPDHDKTSNNTLHYTNAQGGETYFLPQLSAATLSQALLRPTPYDVEGMVIHAPGNPEEKIPESLRYIHKERDGYGIFYVANLSEEPFDREISLRGKGRYEIWNPHTGESYPIAARYEKQGKENRTLLRLTLPSHRSLFLVETR